MIRIHFPDVFLGGFPWNYIPNSHLTKRIAPNNRRENKTHETNFHYVAMVVQTNDHNNGPQSTDGCYTLGYTKQQLTYNRTSEPRKSASSKVFLDEFCATGVVLAKMRLALRCDLCNTRNMTILFPRTAARVESEIV